MLHEVIFIYSFIGNIVNDRFLCTLLFFLVQDLTTLSVAAEIEEEQLVIIGVRVGGRWRAVFKCDAFRFLENGVIS